MLQSPQRFLRFILFVALLSFSAPVPVHGAEVNGIWTDSSTKDLGDWTGIGSLKKIKIRGWLES